jgi:hypothetical protein
MDEKRTHNNEPGSTSDEHNESYSAATLDNTITIDDVLSTKERTLPNGNTITIIKRTTQTELIVPIRDPKTGQAFHTARVVLEPWATDPKKMPDHVREDLARSFLIMMIPRFPLFFKRPAGRQLWPCLAGNYDPAGRRTRPFAETGGMTI